MRSAASLSRHEHLERFAPEAFDYVVVDEFHHAAAASYRRLIAHFRPTFLLGLTATPERSDGGDLLALCQQNLVYRCDLVEGVRKEFGVMEEHAVRRGGADDGRRDPAARRERARAVREARGTPAPVPPHVRRRSSNWKPATWTSSLPWTCSTRAWICRRSTRDWTDVQIDGQTYSANFVKVAINVVRQPGGEDNELPRILRGWFGPDAGAPGTRYAVALDPVNLNVVMSAYPPSLSVRRFCQQSSF